MPYIASDHAKRYDPEALRQRIPGWGVDSDPADRPSHPRELVDAEHTGAHWTLPVLQEPREGRECSIEHEMLTPVFGTAQPLHGLSGMIRRFAYDNYSEGQSAHWLLLVLGDRVESVGAHLRSFASSRPDNPITQTGILAESGRHPIASRYGVGRADVKHSWLDPIIVAGPWVLAGVLLARSVVRLSRR
jgi:hypothetical protein